MDEPDGTPEPGRPAPEPRTSDEAVWRATRVVVGFTARGEAKSHAAVQHERLPDAEAAAEAKAYSRGRMVVLKALLVG